MGIGETFYQDKYFPLVPKVDMLPVLQAAV